MSDVEFDTYYNEPLLLEGWQDIGPDCNAISNGSWQVTSQPKYGIISTAIQYGYLSCAIDGVTFKNYYLPFNYILYTWTITPPPISTTDPVLMDDTFSATWSAIIDGGHESYNFDIKFTCPTPSITSITPNTWNAGQAYNVTITGNNFVTTPNATELCSANMDGKSSPNTLINVIAPSGSKIVVSNVNILSETQITATIAPPIGEPTETANFQMYGGYQAVWGSIPVQVVGCPKPSVTQLLPKTWFAGESYPITITGTGFTTQANATSSCPVTPVAIKTASGSSVSLSNVTVVSPTQITATVEPAASDSTGVAALTIGTSSNGAVTIRTQILGNQIQWVLNGTTTTISTSDGSTPPIQNAVVGQQLALTTTTPTTTTYDGSPVSETWTIDNGTNIGGYSASTAEASVTPMPPLTTPSLTFYSISPQDGVSVTYKYCVNIAGAESSLQCSLPANAVFDVTGPKSVNLYTCQGQALGCSANGSLPPVEINLGPMLEFSGPGILNGMMFTASDDPASPIGTFSYVQLLNYYNAVYTYNQDVYTAPPCTANSGSGGVLDNYYPYPLFQPGSAIDNPDVPLFLDDTEVTASFQADMFLLWTSSISGSIPVPLGYIEWGWYGDAVQNLITQTWSINPNNETISQGYAGSFVQSSIYPRWTGVSLKTTPMPCVR